MTPTLHSLMYLHDCANPWPAFRAGCTSGGTSPRWTEAGDDPADWHSPPDAAGGLVLRTGDTWRASPPPLPPLEIETVVSGIFDAAAATGIDLDVFDVHAAYFSSGGRGVFLLLQIPQDPEVQPNGWVIAVGRDGAPYVGHTEAAVLQAHPAAELVTM